jgi:Holliday junction resolvase
MPNKNYQAGRRFEYEVMRAAERQGMSCVRASGSHGLYDVIAFHVDRKPQMVSCKVVAKEADAARLIKHFREHTQHAEYFHQTLAVKIKGKYTQYVTV